MSDYKPIACGLHEQYQLAVLQKQILELVWKDAEGTRHRGKIVPKDLYTREKAEYLFAETMDKVRFEIRLDHILEAYRVGDKEPLFDLETK